jgi:hypothetical protein
VLLRAEEVFGLGRDRGRIEVGPEIEADNNGVYKAGQSHREFGWQSRGSSGFISSMSWNLQPLNSNKALYSEQNIWTVCRHPGTFPGYFL